MPEYELLKDLDDKRSLFDPAAYLLELFRLLDLGVVSAHQVHERLPFQFECGCEKQDA
jgi:hypothetical protein